MKHYKGITLSHETSVYATHQPALIWAIENSNGNVLELGTGDCSTVVLHDILQGSGKKLVSVDDNIEYMKKYTHLENEEHEFHLIPRTVHHWKEKIDEFSNTNWGVVFVDQGETEDIFRPSRNYSVQKLVDVCDFVIAHDADIFPEMRSDKYNWFVFFPKYLPAPDGHLRFGPPTYIFSKKHDLKNINIRED